LAQTAPSHEIQQNPQVVLAGTVSLSNDQCKLFFFHAHQELTNFLDWDYIADQTKIPVRTAINVRKFEGEPDVPSERSHVIIRGQFDDYLLDPHTKRVRLLMIMVESFEVLCGPCSSNQEMHVPPVHRRNVSTSSLLSTPATPSSLDEDWDIGTVDEYYPFAP